MVVFLVPPRNLRELEKDVGELRAGCAGASDPAIEAFLAAVDRRIAEAAAKATLESVEAEWRGAIRDAQQAVVLMKQKLGNHIRSNTEPVGYRDTLRAFNAAIERVKRARES